MLPVQPDFADITVVVFSDDITLVLITIKLNVYEYN